MPIVNDSPLSIEAGEYWATALYITPQRINGTLVPYDGTVIVDDPALVVRVNQALPPEISGPLFAAAAALTGGPVEFIRVNAPSPARNVVAQIGSVHLADLFAALGQSQEAGGAYAALIDWLSDAVAAAKRDAIYREAAAEKRETIRQKVIARRLAEEAGDKSGARALHLEIVALMEGD